MRREYFSSVVVGLAVVALVAAVGNRLYAQEQEVERGVRRVVIVKDGAADHDEDIDRLKVELELKSEFWIGAMCTEANEALRSQLNLKDGNGLVVVDVVPDSPAAKAGLKKHDVIVSIGDKQVGKVSDLVKALDAAAKGSPDAEQAELKLGMQRAGKSETISVKPEKRKESGNKFFVWERGPLDVRMVRPGMVLPKDAKFNIKIQPFRADLPADMTVTITKTGKTPAKIAVKQGAKSWETTADCLEDLPEDVRKKIEPMMMVLPFPKGDRDVITFMPNTEEIHERVREAVEKHRQGAAVALEKAKHAAEKAHGEVVEKGIRFLEEGKRIGVEQLDRRLDDLARQIDSLRKSVEQLKDDRKKEKE